VTIGFGIRNVEHPAVACREMARVLRKGGTLVILEFSLPSTGAVREVYLWYFRRVLPWQGFISPRDQIQIWSNLSGSV
jgi:demethylmenaquinone methyltransferase/2-methoxy-6-polyprenyl-1,4-benzoquinol methylase